MVSCLPTRHQVTFKGRLAASCPDQYYLTQHTDAQHEGVHSIGHHPRAPPGRARGGHHLLGLSFLTLHLLADGGDVSVCAHLKGQFTHRGEK